MIGKTKKEQVGEQTPETKAKGMRQKFRRWPHGKEKVTRLRVASNFNNWIEAGYAIYG